MTKLVDKVTPQSARIASIDFWRGVYLLMIYINHVPGNPFSYLTLKNWGFADSAEPFVFVSGFSAMLAFGKYFELGGTGAGLLRTVKRAWQLFCAHVLLVFAMSAIIAFAGDYTDSKPIMEQMNFSPFFVETDTAILRLLKLGYMPNMTDILPLYIVLVFFFPLGWYLARVSSVLVLSVSAAVWLWANISGVSFNNYPEGMTWYFNPLAWQLLFVAGMVTYKERSRLSLLLRSKALLVFSIAMVLFSFLAAAPWTHFESLSSYRIIPPEVLAYDKKESLSWIRVIHFFALAFLAVRLFPAKSMLWNNRVVKIVSICGRHALPVFCVGIALSLIVHIVLQINGAGVLASGLCVLLGAGALIAMAAAFEVSKATLNKVAKPPSAPARG
ncbi:MAG TPA: hypothetical protein DCY07_01590 [Rhodospirillaceae bacterium]|nr:hypothetical protein [Rhodospirillaceae bacterium]